VESSSEIQRLADGVAIRSVLHAYCDAVDRNDIEAAAALFTEDCRYDFAPGFQGAGREALREVVAAVGQFSATSHHLSNVEVEFEGNGRASSVAYLFAWHRFPDHPSRADAYLWGRYVDALVRTPEGWRIAERRMEIVGHDNFDVPWHGIGRRDWN
jgi:uncharacterized protein (TIGR02246 family)